MHEMMKPRLISAEHARIVAAAGGIIGAWTHLTRSLDEFVASIRAMVDAVGADRVGIGTDGDLLSRRGDRYAWPAIAAEMTRQGLTPDAIAKVGGGNYVRVFARVTAR